MKNSFLYIISVAILLASTLTLTAQSQCNIQVGLTTTSSCCAKLEITVPSTCTNTFINTITIDSDAFPITQAQMNSATGFGSISASIIDPYFVEFNSPYNLAGPTILGTKQEIGEICFTESVNTVIEVEITIPDANSPTGLDVFNGKRGIKSYCPKAEEFKKLHGSAENEYPNRIKAFQDGVFVIGKKEINTVPHAFIAKFDITSGNLLSEKYLELESEFLDFDYNHITNRLIVVGRTLPFKVGSTQVDNKSIICEYDLSLNLINQKMYDHNGREGFDQVLVHKNPVDPTAPIYILGNKNPDGVAPTYIDRTILYNYTNSLAFNWARVYEQDNGFELEVARGFEDLSDGGLLFLGNDLNPNNGAIMKVEGDGSFDQGTFYTSLQMDLYDAYETPGGEIILAGTDFGNNEAILMVVRPTDFQILTGSRFSDDDRFSEIWMDAHNNLYTYGRRKTSPFYNAVYKFQYDPITYSFIKDTSFPKKLEDTGETAYSENRLHVSPVMDKIFYADARKDNPSGFGEFDLFVGSFDLDFSCQCSDQLPTSIIGRVTSNTADFTCTDSYLMEPALEPPFMEVAYTDDCATFCKQQPTLSCDFSGRISCFTKGLNGTVSGGTAPYAFEWDINCDGTVDITGQSTSWTFPTTSGIAVYDVCMTVTDALGNSCSISQSVTLQDNIPPVISCPEDMEISTDPGRCFATFEPSIPVTDNCDDNPVVFCDVTQFDAGTTTTVTCIAIDASGNTSTCTFNVTAVDDEPPTINCPSNIIRTVPACEGGAFVTLPEPVVDDNCPGVTYECSQEGTQFFECGTTTITCTATDAAGNTKSCTYNVFVECQCGEIVESGTSCSGIDENTLDFFITVNSTAGVTNPAGNCTAIVSTNNSSITLNNIITIWSGNQATITGTATVSGCPFPDALPLVVDLNCACYAGGPIIDCSLPVSVETVCCKTIAIDEASVCKEASSFSIPLLGVDNLCDIQQIKWYTVDAPCPPGSWGAPIQVDNTYRPLEIAPEFYDGDICVYAEVFTSDVPCTSLVTEPVTITLCEPVNYTISPAEQEYCYSGSPITSGLLTAQSPSPTPECPDTLQWYDPNGVAIPGANGLTYQPGALSLTNPGNGDCYEDFTYRLEVRSKCGVKFYDATIRLYDQDAPDGTLEMDPVEPLPLCYGEDATLRYTSACAGEPETWNWFISEDGSTFTPITTAGNRNPLYNTNRLYQDTWYQIRKQNGVCPEDKVEIFLPVNESLSITNFTAEHAPFCTPNGVSMSVTYSPSLPVSCDFTIDWYRNGEIIHSTVTTVNSATYTYVPASLDDIAGNYYVKITSNCCDETEKSNVVQVAPPMQVVVAGPCFRCNDQIVTLEGIVFNPIDGATCTYQWYDENGAILGANGTSLQVNPDQDGPFTFEVSCDDGTNTCVQSDVFVLKQCGGDPEPPACPVNNELTADPIPNGLYAAQVLLETASTVQTGTVVEVQAGQTVLLKPGFHAESGSNFTARIADCAVIAEEAIEARSTDEIVNLGPTTLTNYPNPFDHTTTIAVTVPQTVEARLVVFNLNGKPVFQQEGAFSKGLTEVTFEATNLPAGVYYYRFQTKDEVISKSMVLVRN